MSTIPNIVYVVLLGLATSYLTFLTTKGGLTDNRFSSLDKRLTLRGKLVAAVLFLILLLLIGQELNNNAINDEKDNLLKTERNHRDSIITAGVNEGVESNRRKLFQDLSEAFRKQELRLDTLKKDVNRIRDSTKNTVNYYNQTDPTLMIDGNGVTQKTKSNLKTTYEVAFSSHDASSTNFNLNCFILLQGADGSYFDLGKVNFFPKGVQIPKDGKWTTSFNVETGEQINEIELYITGTYKSSDGIKSYNIDNVYSYDLKTNETTLYLDNNRIKIIETINERKKK